MLGLPCGDRLTSETPCPLLDDEHAIILGSRRHRQREPAPARASISRGELVPQPLSLSEQEIRFTPLGPRELQIPGRGDPVIPGNI